MDKQHLLRPPALMNGNINAKNMIVGTCGFVYMHTQPAPKTQLKIH